MPAGSAHQAGDLPGYRPASGPDKIQQLFPADPRNQTMPDVGEARALDKKMSKFSKAGSTDSGGKSLSGQKSVTIVKSVISGDNRNAAPASITSLGSLLYDDIFKSRFYWRSRAAVTLTVVTTFLDQLSDILVVVMLVVEENRVIDAGSSSSGTDSVASGSGSSPHSIANRDDATVNALTLLILIMFGRVMGTLQTALGRLSLAEVFKEREEMQSTVGGRCFGCKFVIIFSIFIFLIQSLDSED